MFLFASPRPNTSSALNILIRIYGRGGMLYRSCMGVWCRGEKVRSIADMPVVDEIDLAACELRERSCGFGFVGSVDLHAVYF